MKRARFLHNAGTDAGRYKVLRHRDQSPLIEDTLEEEAVSEVINRRRDFTLSECIQMRLALDLMEQPGISPSDAKKFVSNLWPSLGPLGKDLEGLANADVWAGWALARDANDESNRVVWSWHTGTAMEVSFKLTAPDRQGKRPFRLLMISASEAARYVFERDAEFD